MLVCVLLRRETPAQRSLSESHRLFEETHVYPRVGRVVYGYEKSFISGSPLTATETPTSYRYDLLTNPLRREGR